MRKEQREFYELFGVKVIETSRGVKLKNKKKAKLALRFALETRRFEIEMYWRPAAYFWTLIGVAFAGYFAILSVSTNDFDNNRYAFIVACAGFVFSFSWYLANMGSKYWQENWENHVTLLEDISIGPLFKTVLRRPTKVESVELNISSEGISNELNLTAPKRFSVSKINTCVSLFTLLIWIVLVSIAANFPSSAEPDIIKIVSGVGTAIFFIMHRFLSKAHEGSHNPVVQKQRISVYFKRD
jgi:hypothetical protein